MYQTCVAQRNKKKIVYRHKEARGSGKPKEKPLYYYTIKKKKQNKNVYIK